MCAQVKMYGDRSRKLQHQHTEGGYKVSRFSAYGSCLWSLFLPIFESTAIVVVLIDAVIDVAEWQDDGQDES